MFEKVLKKYREMVRLRNLRRDRKAINKSLSDKRGLIVSCPRTGKHNHRHLATSGISASEAKALIEHFTWCYDAADTTMKFGETTYAVKAYRVTQLNGRSGLEVQISISGADFMSADEVEKLVNSAKVQREAEGSICVTI